MTILKETLKKIIPEKLIAFMRKRVQNFVFKRSMKTFIKNSDINRKPDDKTIRNLIFGWGNQGFSAKIGYLSACINKAQSTNGPVLECGSGLSTILLGVIAQKRGFTHYALEHYPEWAEKVQRILEEYGLKSVTLLNTPLKEYGQYEWYDVPFESLPEKFSLVICDGPPAQTTGGRYGLLPVMIEYLSDNCIIMLDDASRKEEVEIADRWKYEYNAEYEIIRDDHPYIELNLKY